MADIVGSSNDAIFSRELDGTVTSWNSAAERIFGYHAAEIVGRSSAVLLPPDRVDELRLLMRRIRRGEKTGRFETVRLHKDGRPLRVSLCASPLCDSHGRVLGASTIARDVTAERELEADLIEAGERERERLGRDLHDGLGQQLGGIELLCRSLARSLRQRGLTEAKTASVLVCQIQKTIGQTRALARGLTPVMDDQNGLMLALEELAATTRALFGVRCALLCEQPVFVEEHAAAVHLFRIAQEEVTNAIRHGQSRIIEIGLSRQRGSLRLEVRDEGRGLTRRPVRGAGIGLRTMAYRAGMLGGTVALEGMKPRGAGSCAAFRSRTRAL